MKRLKKEFQALANVFSNHYEDRGCCCHQCPPCGYCTHPGHPDNLAEDPEAWVEMLEPMCEGQEPILLGDDTPALQDGSRYWVKNNQVNRDKVLRQYDGFIPLADACAEYMTVLFIDIERVFGGVA